jgi:hypothetical protein
MPYELCTLLQHFAVMVLRKCGDRTAVCWLFVITLGGVDIATEKTD